jgi:hypothetical protein
MSELINAPMTRKEFMSLPMGLRRKILTRQAAQLTPPVPGTLCKTCAAFDGCDMRDAAECCSAFKNK